MNFTENQKRIFDIIKEANQPLDLLLIMDRHFPDKHITIYKSEHNLELDIPPDVNIYDEFKDLILVLIYVQDNRLVYFEEHPRISYKLYNIHTRPAVELTDLTQLLQPFWAVKISPTFTLHDYIKSGYKTKNDLKFEDEMRARKQQIELTELRLKEERKARENEKQLSEARIKIDQEDRQKERDLAKLRLDEEREERKRERKARKTSQKITIAVSLLAMILPSVLQQYILPGKVSKVDIIKPDTIKVIPLNTLKDTTFLKK